jgi:hypothetical protein
MRSLVCIVIVATFVISGGPAIGQELPEIPKNLELGSLNIPDSPAFEVLGVSPSSVARPGSTRELALTFLSSSGADDSAFPKNLAIEFSPYWWSYHPDLTWDNFNKNNKIGANLAQTFSISIATSETSFKENDIDVGGSGLGLGFRTSFLKGKPSKKAIKAKEQMQTLFQVLSNNAIPDDLTTLPKDENGDPFVELSKTALNKIEGAQNTFRKANLNRVGWRLELAGATAYNFPDDQWDDGELKNTGVWLNTAYRTDEGSYLDHFDFLGVLRYLWNEADDESLSTYDIGARLIWISQNDDIPVSASAEYVYRLVSDGDKQDSDKLAFIGEYLVNKTWSLFASFGKSFDPDYEGNENFFSLLGVNLGYGKGPVVTP